MSQVGETLRGKSWLMTATADAPTASERADRYRVTVQEYSTFRQQGFLV